MSHAVFVSYRDLRKLCNVHPQAGHTHTGPRMHTGHPLGVEVGAEHAQRP